MHYNLVNKNYQQTSKVLFLFVPDKQFDNLITISTGSLTMLETPNAEFQSIEVRFIDKNNKTLEIEDKANISLVIGTGEYK